VIFEYTRFAYKTVVHEQTDSCRKSGNVNSTRVNDRKNFAARVHRERDEGEGGTQRERWRNWRWEVAKRLEPNWNSTQRLARM